jgi:peptidyl-prolyl cis-trans isomerase C
MEPDVREDFMLKRTKQRDGEVPLTLDDVIDEKIDRQIVLEEAVRRGYTEREDIYNSAVSYEDSLLVVGYLEDVIAPRVQIDSSLALKTYQKYPEHFRRPSEVIVQSLTSKTLDDAQENYSRMQAGAEFEWVAKQHAGDQLSEVATGDQWISVAQLPTPIRAELDSLEVGQVTRPFQVETGYTLLLLKDRRQGDMVPFADAAPQLYAELYRTAQTSEIDKAIKKLRDASKIKIHEDVLKSLKVTGTRQ